MEQKRLLWILFSVSLFLLVVVGIGVIWLYPGPSREAVTTQRSEETREAGADFDPVEWVRSEREAPGLQEAEDEDGEENFIVVYGDSSGNKERFPMKDLPKQEVEAEDLATVEPPKSSEPPPVQRSTEKPSPPREPEPETKTIRVTEYWIQTGSYTSKNRAAKIKAELDDLGLNGRILSKEIDGTTYYRVRVGPYEEKGEADKFLGWVKNRESFENSYISQVYREKTVVQ
ncbi:MAG TPA: SPOR domain-containing protein [Sediminispirochaeta sp.]|nr:SPOR domain-containing protein [Sediminispirochaeta sp.]